MSRMVDYPPKILVHPFTVYNYYQEADGKPNTTFLSLLNLT